MTFPPDIIETMARAYWNAGLSVQRGRARSWEDESEDQRITVRQRMQAALEAYTALSPASAAVKEERDVKIGYMDGIDWEEHLGHDRHGAGVFPSVAATRREKKCLADGGKCGIVEVEVRLIRWVEAQDLEAEFTEKKTARSFLGERG